MNSRLKSLPMKIFIEATKKVIEDTDQEKLITLWGGKVIYANLKDSNFRLRIKDNKTVFLFGNVFYFIRDDGEIRLIDSKSTRYLEKIFTEYNLKEAISRLEGQYIGLYIDHINNSFHIFSDRYARVDAFYAYDDNAFYFSTHLNFIFQRLRPEYDQKMLAHFFSVYGWYTPKGFTIYKNIKRLRVGEILKISDSGLHSEIMEFIPLEIENYSDKDLDKYYDILRDSIISRANLNGKSWISSSSGWDSSIILGILVNEFGRKNVGMITGSMKYSKRTNIINKFEIAKINKIGKFFGIKPIVVDLDFKSTKAPLYWQRVLPYYKSKHIYAFSTYNFAKLSDGLNTSFGKGQIVFNGETSDSFHNFGFSQYMTFFHNNKTFSEYADKMNCYLYGPSFFTKVLGGNYQRDKVFQIFQKMMDRVEFQSLFNDKKEIVESYLFPFFYGSPRIPFAKNYANPLLTKKGQHLIYHFPFREYVPAVIRNLSAGNLYSWLIYLYHSFHSQGSTVNVHKSAMEYNQHQWRAPYNDYRLIEFLSKAPEKWGRGLDLNHTKYPLKWVAQNKIKFPYELLEMGPHSYLYDVIEGFSLGAEITYQSGVTDFFKESISRRDYREILSSEYFDFNYLDQLTKNFLNNNNAKGMDLNNLISLLTFVVTGWY